MLVSSPVCSDTTVSFKAVFTAQQHFGCKGQPDLVAARENLAAARACGSPDSHTLRVQVLNNHILAQNLYHNHYDPNPKFRIFGYMDSLG